LNVLVSFKDQACQVLVSLMWALRIIWGLVTVIFLERKVSITTIECVSDLFVPLGIKFSDKSLVGCKRTMAVSPKSGCFFGFVIF